MRLKKLDRRFIDGSINSVTFGFTNKEYKAEFEARNFDAITKGIVYTAQL